MSESLHTRWNDATAVLSTVLLLFAGSLSVSTAAEP